MADHSIVIAGFGGQGLLFTGKLLAYGGLVEGRELSWLPSYGPEMRGGTANCMVILSDEPVGNPLVDRPTILMAMNAPSLEKYEMQVEPGGWIFYDSTLIPANAGREDVNYRAIPATALANENGVPTLANMILLGAILEETGCLKSESVRPALEKLIPASKAQLIDADLKVIALGRETVKN
ncbi:MAG: 2-oxoacid:acceptor oxidoreductase family protein [Clostridiales bacterium]|nr:2-oxoacid:acceptor oxidoreductase family protein [Candidatus Apopatocola equi]MCQ2438176.1 2-oxoacid:acceptor oxidoreductase family protein [Oscillospiraceae bacterium]